jgi:beta-lactamase superfamily II metal-dependent hydrolase
MQQQLGDPPNVAGWQAYYQEPQYDKIWINSDTLPKRNLFTDRMLNTGFARNGKKILIDPYAFAASLPDPANPDKLIDDSIRLLYTMELPGKEKQYMKEDILLSGLAGQMSDHYWTDAWTKLSTSPNDAANKKDVMAKLRNLYKYIMNLPQYQLC